MKKYIAKKHYNNNKAKKLFKKNRKERNFEQLILQ